MKKDKDLIELEHKIEIVRQDMINIAAKHGYTSHESVRLSQELDKLLNQYTKKTGAKKNHI
ncbi:aspartyl-phosphate phosphatase Spo0E family protein [Alkalibacillus almallahensis]|uniref:aspartyl-phosphate phosphatase Spo0E family protein n=1 Tax=Alkalibacillus almallahensis TaxID=1379154 RepID=UPI0014234235|nr:aspartyl-phosphate phosphatase Spo0E family protein [Alkalibacillus almallahensis]NIK13320.1 stage 0 sporulation regulatory protein [Alkalibacillus almallahensis]